MLILNNVETTDDYSADVTLESLFGGRLVYLVANASVVARFRPIPDLVVGAGSKVAEYGPEQVLTPQSSFIDKISGVKFRSAVSGTPGRVVATLSEPGDILPASGTPFTGTLAASGGVGVTGVIDRDTALIDVAATGAETDVYSFTVPGGTLAVDGQLRAFLQGDMLYNNVAGNTCTLRLYFGPAPLGTLQLADNPSSSVLAAARQPWTWRIEISNLGSLSSQMITAELRSVQPDAAAPVAGAGAYEFRNDFILEGGLLGLAVPAAIDTAADQLLRLTAQWSAASANNSWRKRYAILEAI